MTKNELMDLMQFVIDSNSQILVETTGDLNMDPQQQRTILNALESKTKDCFFRVMDKVVETKKKRSRK